ncbi:MAG: methyltransferase domain-containing protein [Sphingobium sp.]
MHKIAEKLKFFGEFLRSPKMVGSIVPTSPSVIDGLLSSVDWGRTELFVEYGPGVGTFTRPVLERLRPDAQLVAIDTSRNFIDYLAKTISDPRLTLVHGSAADVESIAAEFAGERQANYVLSGLPFSTLPEGVGDAIAAATSRILAPEGAFLVYQYSGFVLPLLRPHFPEISKEWIWRNVPPCMITAARKHCVAMARS